MAVDPISQTFALTVGELARGLTVELIAKFTERKWKRGHFPGLKEAQTGKLVDRAAQEAETALRRELAHIPANEVRAAHDAVLASLRAVSPIEITDALAAGLRQQDLETYVRERSAGVLRRARLDEAARAVYDHVLSATCEQVLLALQHLPNFETLVQVDVHHDVKRLLALVQQVVDRHEREGGAAATFERRYLGRVAKKLGELELFGASLGYGPRGYAFEDAYVSLAVARTSRRSPDEDDDLTGAGVEATIGLAEHRRVLLRGSAGAGKTTLLQWLAVRACHDPGRAEAVPFFLPLRQYARRELPTPEELPDSVAKVVSGEMPPGWVTEQLRTGRALVLVDGVDELSAPRRREAKEWLEDLVDAYGEARFVVSARPFATREDWLVGSGFVTFDLLPMSLVSANDYVARWHRAARSEQPAGSRDWNWLHTCERSLVETLRTRQELRRLAANPLLCGLLCALHREEETDLPLDHKGLYDAALRLLLDWDRRRRLEVEGLPELSNEEQTVLLQRFAYTMVQNHDVVVDRDDAVARIDHAMMGLRSRKLQPEPVLQRTLERTGVLREPNQDQVQFVHRTFRDYLAAKEVADSGALSSLVERAHEDYWYDVVVNAVAHARPRERDDFLRKLLEAGDALAATDARRQSRLHLVAAACLTHADVLSSDDARELVEQAVARLIPPASLDEADMLARAGPFVLDLLPGPEGLTPDQAAAVVRAAAMSGGEGVLDKLSRFGAIGQSRVVDELLRAWRRSDDPEDYAKRVLADVEFGDRRLDVRSWYRVRCLPHLRHLTDVACYGDIGDLEPFGAMPQLRRLELVQNEAVRPRNLRSLAASSTLETLVLTAGCLFLDDLTPLAETTITTLELRLTKADIGTLRSPGLRKLALRDQRIDDGLGALPGDLPLRELVVDNLPGHRDLRGIERWQQLERISLRGVPTPDDTAALAELPELRLLTIRGVDGPADLADLAGLAGLGALRALRELHIEEVTDRDRPAVLLALPPRPGLHVRINGEPATTAGRLGPPGGDSAAAVS